MTVAEHINAGLSYYLNQGSSSLLTDAFARKKALFYLTKVVKRIYNSAPYWFKFASSTCVLTSGEGTLPSNFSHMGTQGRVYLSGGAQEITYQPPEVVNALIYSSPQSGTPRVYTFSSRTSAGFTKILCYPTDSSTLLLRDYVRKTPELIDAPLAPTPTVTVTSGNPTGTYTYVVTNVTADGETEGGQVSASLVTGGAFKVSVLIPKSEHLHTLTARSLYRTATLGYQHKLVASIVVATAPAHLDYTYLDNIADGSLGANCPLPSAAVSGIESIPTEFHESAIFDGLVFLLAASQDDGRTPALSADWDRSVRRLWEEVQPGQNQIFASPAFPNSNRAGGHPVWSYWQVPR
jgi:hypothetical protein